MDPINPIPTSPAPYPASPSPQKSSHLILASTIILLVFIISMGSFWLFTSLSGQKLLNTYFPNPARTFSLMKGSVHSLKSYDFDGTVTIGTSTPNTISGFIAKDTNKEFFITYKNKSTINSSGLTAHIITANGKTYGQDSFDGTWHYTDEGAENRLPISEIIQASPDTLINQSCENTLDPLRTIFTDSTITVNCEITETLPDSFKAISSLTFNANRSTYEITSLSLAATTKSSNPIAVELHFKNHNMEDKVVTAPISLNPFGDFLARETLVINSNQNKSFDYFWNAWEKTNFGCTKCVNPMADSDNDGILNGLEFLFGTNPKNAFSGNQSKNDLAQLKDSTHPATGQRIPELFASSTLQYLKNYTLSPIKNAAAAFSPYSIRQTGASIPVIFKPDAKIISVVYLSDLPAGNYVTVFIGNSLAQIIDIEGTSKSNWVNIPVSNYAGTNAELTVVLNPYSKLNDGLKMGTFSIDFPNLHINPYNKSNPFYIDATSASLKSLSGITTTNKSSDTSWKIGTNRVLEWYGPANTIYSLIILDSQNQQPIGSIALTEGAEAGDKQHGYAWVVGSYTAFTGGAQKTLPPGTYKISATYINSDRHIEIPVATASIY